MTRSARSARLLGAATILAGLAASFALHQYHAARQLACAAYARGSDNVAFVHPCLDARATAWAGQATIPVLFVGLWLGTSVLRRSRTRFESGAAGQSTAGVVGTS